MGAKLLLFADICVRLSLKNFVFPQIVCNFVAQNKSDKWQKT